jgi:Ser-tRNA(Ala) deacylase AlaX
MATTDAAMTRDDSAPTDMLYYTYEGNWLAECTARILSMEIQPPDQVQLRLDRTILHAQGGGQPTDTGTIATTIHDDTNDAEVIHIHKVLRDRVTGWATHYGTWTSVPPPGNNESSHLSVGSSVQVAVNQEWRRILSECHTAGHVVDAAMVRCGLHMKPSKAYHFLEGPYVEYQGEIPAPERDAVLYNLQAAFADLVQENIATQIELMSPDEANARCNRQADNFDMNVFMDPHLGQIRVVTVAGYPCPCGGTHVRSTDDLQSRQWGITGLKCKKGIVRVKYGQGSVSK